MRLDCFFLHKEESDFNSRIVILIFLVPVCGFQRTTVLFLIFFGGYKAVVRPVPIPNTAVKRSLADGSGCIASARVGYRQILFKPRRRSRFFFFQMA